MNETEFARFVKDGLGSPVNSHTLAARVATDIHARTLANPTWRPTSRNVLFGRRIAIMALTVAVIGALNLGGAYFFPSYGEALANAPFIGGVSRSILSGTGLLHADLSAVSDVSTSNGHTLRLVAGYADGVETILLVEIDGQSLANAGPPSKKDRYLVVGDALLSDQFGHEYQKTGTPSGDQRPAIFGPLVEPTAKYGARLTLHVQRLFNVGTGQSVDGDWTLHATLFGHAAHVITPPTPVVLAGNTFTITSIRSGAVLQVRYMVTGPNVGRVWSDWMALQDPARPSQDPFWPKLSGPGTVSENGGYSIDTDRTSVSGEITALVPTPGTYTIEFGSPVIGAERRTIVVPKQ